MESTRVQDDLKTIKIPGRRPVYVVSFAEEGERVFGGGGEGILRQWRVHDGHKVGPPVRADGAKIYAAALSPDQKWLVCGLERLQDLRDQVRIWDVQTRKKVLDISGHKDSVFSVHILQDSTKFATGSADKTASIWSMATGERLVGPLWHDGVVVAVQFSPDGDRLATATAKDRSIRIYNLDGKQLLDIPFSVNAHISSPLAWSADGHQLFASAYSKVKCFNSSSGSLLSQWSVPGGGSSASVALSHNRKFIVVAAYKSLSFWDAITLKQIGTTIEHASPVWSVALCPNDYRIATGEENGMITFRDVGGILPGSYIMVNLPLIHISDEAFKFWSRGDLTRTEELLTEETNHPFHRARALSLRALVRTRLKQWDLAIDDARKSLELRPSVASYTAIAMANVGIGKHELAMPVFDLVFSVDIPGENRFLLLIKAIVLFECGKHDEAISRVDSLINIVKDLSLYVTIRARMFLILADMSLTQGDHEGALTFFKRARKAIPFQSTPHLVVISLIFGWTFDNFVLAIRLGLQKCAKPFEDHGDTAMQSRNLEEAVKQYSTALSLNPSCPASILIKRSKAQVMLGLREDALKDADEAITAEPDNARGYERRHAALHAMQRYDEAIDAFTCMMSLIQKSGDHDIRQLAKRYVSPSRSTTAIEGIVYGISKACPFVLIDVESGHLCDGSTRMHTFKSETQFKELVSSMTEELDDERIRQVVTKYFQYVMLSHVWEGKEPLFQDVNQAKSVWSLDSSPLNEKLKGFCEVVRKGGYRWAWSDTCCIDKTIQTVLNQSLTLMYLWYEASAATFVHLRDVDSSFGQGGLKDSKWMTRSWTSQELLAPELIRFYDNHWEPYLGDSRCNHKESPEIMQEIANVIGVARETVTTFHPDDLSIREKLRLASMRNATVEEDAAYSLIGIFKSDIRPHYGEKYAALGHLLEEIVDRSGNVTVLDWAGKSSPYNSCLPATLAVYSHPPYTWSPIEDAQMDVRVAELRAVISRTESTLFYDRVFRLPRAGFANRRLRLPSILFRVEVLEMQNSGDGPEHRYRARASRISETVIFQTSENISLAEPHKLVFVHPWIHDLLDPLDASAWGGTVSDEDQTDSKAEAMAIDDYTRALRLVARLCQPFHALLLQQQPNRGFVRIATENKICVSGMDYRVNLVREVRTEVVDVLPRC